MVLEMIGENFNHSQEKPFILFDIVIFPFLQSFFFEYNLIQ